MVRWSADVSCEGLFVRGGDEGRGGATAGFRELHDLSRNVAWCGAGSAWLEPPEVGRIVVISWASVVCLGLHERGRSRGGEGAIVYSLGLPGIGQGEGGGDGVGICGGLPIMESNVGVAVSATSSKLHLVGRDGEGGIVRDGPRYKEDRGFRKLLCDT